MIPDKSKRKVKPNRRNHLRRLLMVLCLLLLVSLVIGQVYRQKMAANDGADIAFLSNDGTLNIYTLDVDNPEAEPVAVTHFTTSTIVSPPNFIAPNIAQANGGNWLAFQANYDGENVVQRVDIRNGRITTLAECADYFVDSSCRFYNMSSNGRYILLGGYIAKDDLSAGRMMLIDLEHPRAEPVVMSNYVNYTQFVDDEAVIYFEYIERQYYRYDIATGDRQLVYEGISANFNADATIVFQPWASLPRQRKSFTVTDLETGEESKIRTWYGHCGGNPVNNPEGTLFLVLDCSTEESGFDRITMFGPNFEQVILNAEIGEIIVEHPEFHILELEWNPEGTQFIFLQSPESKWAKEGSLWVYDLESRASYPVNAVGRGVIWLD